MMRTDEMSRIRRALHRHAEPGFLEFYTASLIMDTLYNYGVPYLSGRAAMDVEAILETPAPEEYQQWGERALAAGVPAERVEFLKREGTAVIATLKGNRPGPTWGIRVDIDALPIHETEEESHIPNREGFRSETPYMHACGHDGHTVIGLALASRLADGNFPGQVKILFQPAEEGVRGAIPMLAAGATEGVERMIAIHNQSSLPVGTLIGGIENHKAITSWRARFTGQTAHPGGTPEKGRNAIAAAVHATQGILSIRRYSTTDTRVNVGEFIAPGAANIIPAEAMIAYEVRSVDNEVVADMNRRTENIMEGAAKMHDVEVRTWMTGRAVNTRPDPEMLDLISAVAPQLPWVTGYLPTANPTSGSEDAHLFIQDVQQRGGIGAYLRVGSHIVDAPGHNDRFDFDERAMEHGADIFEALVRHEG